MKQPTMASPSTVTLFELPFFAGSSEDVMALLDQQLSEAHTQPFVIFTPNPEQVVLAHHHPEFRRSLQSADLLLPDGVGIIWASRRLKKKGQALPSRIPGVQVCQQLLRQYPKKKVLLIGGHGYASATDSTPQEITVEGRSVFWMAGYQNVMSPTAVEEKNIQTALKHIQPEIVFVAFGAPFQEAWVKTHQQLLSEVHVRVVMVVGGAFDMLLGKVKRAPQAWQRLHLEWLYRLIQQPWRWKRQLKLLEFVGLTIS